MTQNKKNKGNGNDPIDDSALITDKSPKVHQLPKMKNQLKIKQYELTEKQKEIIDIASDKNTKILFIDGPAGTAKAQPLSSLVMTYQGPKKMADIKKGSQVINRYGLPIEVLDVYPQGIKKIYEVKFDDGTKTRCCKEHLWLGFKESTLKNQMNTIGAKDHRNVIWGVYSLEEVIDIINTEDEKFLIPNCERILFKDIKNRINPMALGFFYACGKFKQNGIVFKDYEAKIEIIPTVLRLERSINHSMIDNRTREYLNQIWSDNKERIPLDYLHSSVQSRIKFLYGFFGGFHQLWDLKSKNQRFQIEIDSQKTMLMKDVFYMIRSLGAKVFYKTKDIGPDTLYDIEVECPRRYLDINFDPKDDDYDDPDNLGLLKYIESITEVGEEECQCILVNDPEHVYLTDDFIVTHNTFLQTYLGLDLMNKNQVRKMIYIRSLAESASKGMGFLPGESNEKFKPFAAPLEDKLFELISKPEISSLMSEKRIEAIPINFLRGLSFNSSLIALDEAQNCDFKEITTAMTRIGKFSKMVICGDQMQSDINGKSGFKRMIDLFDDEESRQNGIYVFRLTNEDILRSGIVGYIVSKIEKYNNISK